MPAEHFLSDFSRRQWVSAQARSLWEPRICAIGQQFAAAERASVGTIRSAAIQNASPERFQELAQHAIQIGAIATPLGLQGRSDEYAASSVDLNASEPWEHRLALTTPVMAAPFLKAWRNGDDEIVGQLLGYPKCCRRFFAETWGAGSVDPTWDMADHSVSFNDEGDGPIEANILLRWLGVRYIPHMPCGFRCEGTVELGRKFRALIPEREREWMDELLSMPMLWTSLNGIGEVTTPIVTLNFRSDPRPCDHERFEIRRQGTSYPEAGAYGGRFPYRSPAQRPDEYLWTDNGFSSRKAMDLGHGMVLSALRMSGLPQREDDRTIVDLGAGNGELLRKLSQGIGVESNAARVGRKVWPGVILGQIQDVEDLFSNQRFSIAIISVRRFEELEKDELEKLATWFLSNVKSVLVYQYDMPIFARLATPYELELLKNDPWRGRCIISIPKVAK